jgi:Tol biopolymer transport system component
VKIPNDWSPDGKHLVYSKQAQPTGLDLWTVTVEDGDARPLIATPYNETQARISPDGQWIAYASDETSILETYVARFPGRQANGVGRRRRTAAMAVRPG